MPEIIYLAEIRSDDDSIAKRQSLKRAFGPEVYPISPYYFLVKTSKEIRREELKKAQEDTVINNFRLYRLEELTKNS